MGRHNAFTFPFTFFREPATKVIPELKRYGFTGINLALNYHASRDFLLRQGPALEYLADGFHYYRPDLSHYEADAVLPDPKDALIDNQLLDGVMKVATDEMFDINAWAVFLHNSAIGYTHPEFTVTNCLGNHFLSELCPSSPQIGGYIKGMTADLASRGITSLAIESLHFHGVHHGEHHERFFIELGEVAGFLLALCFCSWCIANFSGDGMALKAKIALLLQPLLSDGDPWLDKVLTPETLGEIAGVELLEYLHSREKTVAQRYQEVATIATRYGVTTRFIDQAPLIPGSGQRPLEKSWQFGIDNQLINELVDTFEPLIYRKSADEVGAIARNYLQNITTPLTAILRPTYPDNLSAQLLAEKVAVLRENGVTDIDFYLLDAMRPRDLEWISRALKS